MVDWYPFKSYDRSAWDLVIFVCTIYVAALVPYQAVFNESGYELRSK